MRPSPVRAGVVAICLVAVVIAARAQQVRDNASMATGTAVIAGVVTTDGPAPKPIRRARVVLQPWTRRGGLTIVTDDAGRFVFKNLAADRYQITAYKDPYLATPYGARRVGGVGTEISIAAGQQASIAIAMVRGAVLSGTVYDAAGRPAPGVTVAPMRYTYDLTGSTTLRRAGRGDSRTDDRGAYRFWNLEPGQYIVMAQAPLPAGGRGGPAASEVRRITAEDMQRALALLASPSALPPGGGASPIAALPPGEPVTYAPVFHPNVTDLSQASSLRVQAGEERTGIDLVLRRVATASVRGTLSGLGGADPRAFSITVTPGGVDAELLGTLFQSVPGTTRPDNNGAFVIAGLAPGQYIITAKPNAQALGVSATDPLALTWASADVTAVEGGVHNAALELKPPIRITGRLAFEGTAPKPASATGLTLRLLPRGSGGNLGAGPSITVSADGSFTVPSIMPGRYRVLQMGPIPAQLAPYRLTNAVANGRDALDFGLEVRSESIDWVLTMRDRSASIEGTLQSAAGIGAPDYSIVIFTTDSNYWVPGARRVISVRPATDGAYTSGMLPAGDYFIAALTDVEPGEWNNRAFLEQLVPAAIKVTLGDGQKLVQDIKLK